MHTLLLPQGFLRLPDLTLTRTQRLRLLHYIAKSENVFVSVDNCNSSKKIQSNDIYILIFTDFTDFDTECKPFGRK